MNYTITEVTDDGEHWNVGYFADTDVARERGVMWQIPHDAAYSRMALYGLKTVAEGLDCVIREGMELRHPFPVRDDPALRAGWVTSRSPDAQIVNAYTARSAAEAQGSLRARHAAMVHAVHDPDGLLPRPQTDRDRLQHHVELADLTRWLHNYGGLPRSPRDPNREHAS
jgi:hypothetical protein